MNYGTGRLGVHQPRVHSPRHDVDGVGISTHNVDDTNSSLNVGSATTASHDIDGAITAPLGGEMLSEEQRPSLVAEEVEERLLVVLGMDESGKESSVDDIIVDGNPHVDDDVEGADILTTLSSSTTRMDLVGREQAWDHENDAEDDCVVRNRARRTST